MFASSFAGFRRSLLVLAALAVAQAAAAQTTGSISGRVTGSLRAPALQVAVFTATTQLRDATFAGAANVDFSTNQYSVSGLAPGTYFVRTVVNGNSPVLDMWYPGLFVAANGVRPQGVTVTAGATTTGIDFVLTDVSGGISGTVTLATLPFKGQVLLPAVQVYNEDGIVVKTGQLLAGPGASAGSPITTDPPAGGTFTWTVGGLPTGRYFVRTKSIAQSAPNNGHIADNGAGWWVDELYDNIVCVAEDCTPDRGTPIIVTSGGGSTPSAVNMTLDYGAQIMGALPVPTFVYASVEIYDARGVRLPNRAASIAQFFGTRYFADGLPAGSYFVKLLRDSRGAYPETLYKDQPCNGCAVTSGTPVTVSLGETKDGIDFVQLPNSAIRGTVRSGGAPLSQVSVEVFTSAGAQLGTTATASDGTYAFPGLNPGTFYLRTIDTVGYVDVLYPNQPCPGCDPLQGGAVTVASGADTTGADFNVAQGVSVSGIVQSLPPASSGRQASPIAGVGVSLYTAQDVRAARAVSDRSGRFTVTVAPGTYFAFTDPEPGYQRQLFRNSFCAVGICDFSSATPIQPVSSSVTGVDFQLPQCTAPSVSPVRLATAAVGIPYRQTLAYSAGQPLGTFMVTAGRLPPGLALGRLVGVLSGTPTTAGSFTFTVAAETTDCVGSRTYTLDVPACAPAVPATITVPAAGDAHLYGYGCPVTSSADAAWIKASVTTFDRPGPSGTTRIYNVAVNIDPNPASAARTGHLTIGSRVIPVFQSGTAMSAPFGVLETPANGAVVTGSMAISGWALDDLGVSRVAIYRDPVAGEGMAPVYLGDATIVTGARPDVEAAFPAIATRARAGWGYLLLTNMLPNQGNGTFNVYAYADDADKNRTLIGVRTISAVNASATAPFGAIDTPDQGAIIAGSGYVNFGWALTPQPKLIPVDGSTISVVIDGVPVGKVTSYNLARSDVSGLFPGRKNSGGPVGYRVIDTTALSEGVHTIAWVVTDDAGQATGIGSRYFTVQNSAWLPSLKTASAFALPPAFAKAEVALADSATVVPARIDGVDAGRMAASLATLPIEADGARTIDLRPLQRLELTLGTEGQTFTPADACAPSYDGYLAANGELRALPIGASLDRTGTFYWQPGPGFLGSYQLVFVRTTCEGTRTRIPVSVRIR
jgi:putative Ig domain-containing protein/carboxypeptidase family protein